MHGQRLSLDFFFPFCSLLILILGPYYYYYYYFAVEKGDLTAASLLIYRVRVGALFRPTSFTMS